MNSVITYNQWEQIWHYADLIIENLDIDSLNELMQGNDGDIDSLLQTLYSSIHQTIHYQSTDALISPDSFGYLEKFTNTAVETLRCSNLSYFILDVLPDFHMNWHHIEWANMMQIYRLLCLIAARDHSKSYTCSFANALWHLYRYKKPIPGQQASRDLELSKEVLLFTHEYKLAKIHLGKVREEIEVNDILRERLYPKGVKDGWGKEELHCANGSKYMIRSYGSNSRGLHVGRIIVDDFLDESNLYSLEQRQKHIDYVHAVVSNVLVPNGSCVVTGTPFHDQDLYGDLKKKSGWKVFVYPAIFPDGSLLWESRYNLPALLDKRNSQGPIIFSREILCHPVTSDSTIFPYQLISRAYNKMDQYKMVRNIMSFPRKFLRVAVGCDFAFSGNVGADYSCFVVIGVDDLRNYWLLHVYREKGKTYNEQMAALRRINNDFKPDIIFVESNQAQSMFASGGKEAGMPVYPDATTTNKYDLRGGLPGLVIPFEQDRMRWPRGDEASRAITDWLQGEFSSIIWSDSKLESASQHDDGVMAYWKAIRAANYIGGKTNFDFL